MLCRHFNDCGGCDAQDKDYSRQLSEKKARLEELFKDIEGLSVEDVVPSPDIWHYRNKMEYAVKRFEGHILIGLRKKKKFYRVVDLEECLIFHGSVKAIFDTVKSWIDSNSIELYDLFKHTGALKYVALRHGKFYDEMMVVIVVASTPEKLEEERPKYMDLVERLRKMSIIKSVYLSVNNGVADVAITGDLVLLWGEDAVRERINDVDYRIKPASFFQTNPSCCAKLYEVIRDEAARLEQDEALDLFCGSGGITLQLAKHFRKVTGIDISPQNIEDAKRSAASNKVSNVEFICEDAQAYLLKLKESGAISRLSAIIVDPPRSGLSKETRKVLAGSDARGIIYVSCNASSLKEDLKDLAPSYKIERIVPVDMFPHTRHLEVVAILKRSQ